MRRNGGSIRPASSSSAGRTATRASGKDPTKVDRSAAYAARYLAKNIVAAGMAEKCSIQLSYAIGISRPLSIYADTYGTGQVHEAEIERAVAKVMDLTPRGIREHLELNKPIYQRTAAYGHFGRKPEAEGGLGCGDWGCCFRTSVTALRVVLLQRQHS